MTGGGQVLLLQKGSEEYLQIAHLLQLSVRSTNIHDVSIWSISNPSLSLAFERRSSDLLSLDSWVDVNALDDQNPIQEICNRGFVTPDANSGLMFTVGNINFSNSGVGQTQQQYLLCTVAVGRSYVVDSSSGAAVTEFRRPPATYDSLYIHSESSSTGYQAASGNLYRHNYVVFDGAQVLPRYVVHFTYDPTLPLQRTPIGNINLLEIKAKIADALSVLGPAAAMATESMLSNIEEKYTAALAAAQNPDALFEERRRSILDALAVVDGRLLAIQNSAKTVEEEIYKRVQEAIFALQDETAKKMNALLAEELELRRQLGQLDWVDSFTTLMAESLPLMSFVTAWERHSSLRNSLHSSLGGPVTSKFLDQIKDDLYLAGKLEIKTEDSTVKSPLALMSATQLQGTHTEEASGASKESKSAWEQIGNVFKHELAESAAASGTRTLSKLPGVLGSDIVFFSRASNSNVPILTLKQAEAELARAKADLEAIELAIEKSANVPRLYGGDSLILLESHSAKSIPTLSINDITVAKKDVLTRIIHIEEQVAYFRKAFEQTPSTNLTKKHDKTSEASSSIPAYSKSASPIQNPVLGQSRYDNTTSFSSSHGDFGLSSAQRPPSALSTLAALNHVNHNQASQRLDDAGLIASNKMQNVVKSIPLHDLSSFDSGMATTNLSTRTFLGPSQLNTVPAQSSTAHVPSLAQRISRFSMIDESLRRKRQRAHGESIPSSWMFAGSTILSPEQAEVLYNTLPFCAPDANADIMRSYSNPETEKIPPYTRLINAFYGGNTQGGVSALLRKYRETCPGTPTVIIVRANGEIFGGYAADSWDCTGFFGGTPRSFLFSMTKDTKIPFHGRVKGPTQSNDAYLRKKHEEASRLVAQDFQMLLDEARAITGAEPVFDAAGKLQLPQVDENGREYIMSIPVPRPKPFVRHDALRSTSDSLQWGLEDLVIQGDLTSCFSVLENSYGIGFTKDESSTFLANSSHFAVEALEFWSIVPSNAIPPIVPGKEPYSSHSRLPSRTQLTTWSIDPSSVPISTNSSSMQVAPQGVQGHLDLLYLHRGASGVIGSGIGIGSGYDQSYPSITSPQSNSGLGQVQPGSYSRSQANVNGVWQ